MNQESNLVTYTFANGIIVTMEKFIDFETIPKEEQDNILNTLTEAVKSPEYSNKKVINLFEDKSLEHRFWWNLTDNKKITDD